MPPYDHILTFRDLTKDVIRTVADERDRAPVIQLLRRLESISAPQNGSAKIILLLCAVARFSRWLPEKLCVDLERLDQLTSVDILFMEGETRERLCKLTMRAPLEEFDAAVGVLERSDAPMRVRSRREERGQVQDIHLEMTCEIRSMTMPPEEMSQRVQQATLAHHASSHPPIPNLTMEELPSFAADEPASRAGFLDTTDVDSLW